MSIIVSSILIVAIGAISAWNFYISRSLSTDFESKLDADCYKRFHRSGRFKNLQLIVVMLCMGATIIFYNEWVESLEKENMTLKQSKDSAEMRFRDVLEIQEKLAAELQQLNKAALEKSVLLENNNAQKATEAHKTELEDIYNPEEQLIGNESKIDGLKKRFENILVIHLFLKKCEKTGSDDFFIIMASLSQEMASINAPGRLQHDIITAAQGSYKEIYAKSDCSDKQTDSLITQYNDYIKVLSTNALTQQ